MANSPIPVGIGQLCLTINIYLLTQTNFKMKRTSQLLATLILLMMTTTTNANVKPEKKTVSIKHDIVINAPIEKVWNTLVENYGGLHNYSPSTVSSYCTNNATVAEMGAGRVCQFDEKGKKYMRENIVLFDAANYYFENQLVETSYPMDTENTMATYKLTANADGTTTLTQEVMYRMKPAFMGGLMKGAYRKTIMDDQIGFKYFIETGNKSTEDTKKDLRKKYESAITIIN